MRTSFTPTSLTTILRRGATSLALAAASVAAVPAAAQSAPIPANAKYACDFESGYCDFSEQSKIGSIAPTGTGTRRSSLVSTSRTGGQGVRLHTEPGDSQVNGSGDWERNDLQKPADSSYCNEGQEEWWAVSVMFPSDFVMPASGQGGVVVDFHHTGSSGVPNFGVELRGESGMRISGYGGAVNGGQYRAQIADPWGAVNNVTRNVWYDFVFHIKWSASGGGFAEAWLNGKKVLAHTGATLYSGQSCYLKLANYHAASGKASSTIFDRVVRGTSAADVAITALEGVSGFFAPSTPAAPTTAGSTGITGTTGTTGSTGSTGTSGTSTAATGKAAASATMDSSAYTTSAGQGVTFTARLMGNAATPGGTVAFSANGNPIPGCGSIAVSGGYARCTTSALAGGQHRITGAYSGDSSYAPATAGPITQTVTGSSTAVPQSQPSAPASAALNVQGLWWGGVAESGWGVNLTQQGSTVFATWFTYDAQGKPTWLVMSDGRASGANRYTGTVYRTRGPALGTTFDPSKVATTPVGTATFSFGDGNNGTFTAVVDGVQVTKTITRQVFDARLPACAAGGNASASRNYQDLWWRPGGVESGWGLSLAHQGDKLFLTWFTYDADGTPLWLVASDVSRQSDGSYAGTLYRTTGTALAARWDANRSAISAVGSVRFSFGDGANGTFTYTVNGTSGSKPITRQVFSTPATVCTA